MLTIVRLHPVACEHHVGAARIAHRRRTLVVARSEQREAVDVTKNAAPLPVEAGAEVLVREIGVEHPERSLVDVVVVELDEVIAAADVALQEEVVERGEFLLHRVEDEEVVELVVARKDAAVGTAPLRLTGERGEPHAQDDDGRRAKERDALGRRVQRELAWEHHLQ